MYRCDLLTISAQASSVPTKRQCTDKIVQRQTVMCQILSGLSHDLQSCTATATDGSMCDEQFFAEFDRSNDTIIVRQVKVDHPFFQSRSHRLDSGIHRSFSKNDDSFLSYANGFEPCIIIWWNESSQSILQYVFITEMVMAEKNYDARKQAVDPMITTEQMYWKISNKIYLMRFILAHRRV